MSELPGMWEESDLSGGWADTQDERLVRGTGLLAADLAAIAEKALPGVPVLWSPPKVAHDSTAIRRITQAQITDRGIELS